MRRQVTHAAIALSAVAAIALPAVALAGVSAGRRAEATRVSPQVIRSC